MQYADPPPEARPVYEPEPPLVFHSEPAPEIAWKDPTPGRGFFDAPEVSAELVAAAEASVPGWEPAPASAAVEAPAEEARPSMPPPYPRQTPPPAAPTTVPPPALVVVDDEVSLSDAVEVSIEAEAPAADDDAPSLDDLAALTAMPATRTPVVTLPPETPPGSGRR